MGDNEQKALQLMAEAEKKMTSSKGFFGSLFGCVFFIATFFVPIFFMTFYCRRGKFNKLVPMLILFLSED